MYEEVSIAKYFAWKEKERRRIKLEIDLSKTQIGYLMKYASSVISYPSDKYSAPYEYVHNLFPFSGIKDAKIYMVSSDIMSKFGFSGAEGFYSHLLKVIIITASKRGPVRYKSNQSCVMAKISTDEVIVHELLHYADVAEGHYTTSRDVREEFAYGYSIGYLRSKNYTDEEIINNNFLPYLVSIFYDKSFEKVLFKNGFDNDQLRRMSDYKRRTLFDHYRDEITEEAKSMSLVRGKEIIALYTRLLEKGPVAKDNLGKTNRFELLDLD